MKKKNKKGKKARQIRCYDYEMAEESVSSFGGLSLVERLARRLGLWRSLEDNLAERQGKYRRMDIVRGAINGLLSGSRGTATVREIAEDKAILKLLGIEELPGEKIFWEELERLGGEKVLKGLHEGLAQWARKLLKHCDEEEWLNAHGFIPIFGDGSLLEGSAKREGTKSIPSKGMGLMWNNWFVGPLLATEHLSGEAEGEQKGLMDKLPLLLEQVIDPLGWRSKSLVLMDSLHGDGPTLDQLESEKLSYIVGANKLKAAAKVLQELPQWQWKDVPEQARRSDCVAEQTAVAWVQCEGWQKKRLLVGKRFKREGELIWNTVAVISNLPAPRLQQSSQSDPAYAQEIWKLYSAKMGLEDYFKDALIDLSGHRPPCAKLLHNRGYYAVLSLAYNLSRGLDLIGGRQVRQENRQKAKGHKQAPAKPMRIWSLRRRVLTIPARIIVHARRAIIRLLGGGKTNLKLFELYWQGIARC